MSEHLASDGKLFVDWYAEEYDLVGEHVYAECAAYLEGLMDVHARDGATDPANRLQRCIQALRAGANFQRVARQYRVKAT